MLNTVTHICLNVTLIVCPSYTELDYSIWNAKALNQVCTIKLWVLVVFFLNSS